MTEVIEYDELKDAWDRIARTRDGLTVYRHLQRVRLGLAPDNVPDSALPRLEGRRSLAADLMAFMAEGIAENDRACITFAIAKPVPVGATRGAGRRIGPEHYISTYDGPADNTFAGPEPGTNGTGNGAGNSGGAS